MIIILQELMFKLFVEIHGRDPKKEEIPKPCDHFDLIGGTGIGGYVTSRPFPHAALLLTCEEK
jgi:hypothetical protein